MNNIWKPIKKGLASFFGIFSETSPNSLMRFMSFFLFIFSLFETHFILKNNLGTNLTGNHVIVICILLAFSFFPKVVQKVVEKKYNVLEKKVINQLENGPTEHVV